MKDNILYEKPFVGDRECIVIADDFFKDSPAVFSGCPVIYLHAGEEEKDFASVERIIGRLADLGADRSTFLIGMGGGITTDITGFVASIYKRGLDFGLVPTTLLAQVDAAIGGKNGINFNHFKNMAGCFRQAGWIYVDSSYLETLPRRTLLCGAAEMLKTFIIKDADSYRRAVRLFSSPDLDLKELGDLVRRAISIKCGIVESDPFDWGERRLLNLGHSFGHAIEKYNADILHGEAVAIGIIKAAEKSVSLGMMDKDEMIRLKSDFKAVGLPVETAMSEKEFATAMAQDKKRMGDRMTFVLPKRIGEAILWETSATV